METQVAPNKKSLERIVLGLAEFIAGAGDGFLGANSLYIAPLAIGGATAADHGLTRQTQAKRSLIRNLASYASLYGIGLVVGYGARKCNELASLPSNSDFPNFGF